MKLSNQKIDPDSIGRIVTLVAIIASIVVNTITNIFPLNGLNIGTLANTIFAGVHFTPANYAFAIWGAIYIGLIAFGIYQLQPALKRNERLQRCGYLLTIACIAQCAWIYLFLQRQFWLSVVAMFGILIPLMLMHQRLGIAKARVSRQERWFVQIPISLYLGWIAVASVLNVANALYIVEWNGWGINDLVWTVIMMAVSTALGAIVLWKTRDAVFSLVIVWAIIAIVVRQFTVPLIVSAGVLLAITLIFFNIAIAFKPKNAIDRS